VLGRCSVTAALTLASDCALVKLALPGAFLCLLQAHGHVDVPFQWSQNPGLAGWVVSQRARWRGDQGAPLTASQLNRLTNCGCAAAAVALGLPLIPCLSSCLAPIVRCRCRSRKSGWPSGCI
jgi:hypothetical protein